MTTCDKCGKETIGVNKDHCDIPCLCADCKEWYTCENCDAVVEHITTWQGLEVCLSCSEKLIKHGK